RRLQVLADRHDVGVARRAPQELYVQGSVNSGKGQFNGWYAYDLNSEWSEFSASLQSFDA
ncbi:MAG: hypothetical protein ACO3GK_02340, partial [Bacteroidia bacterium]